MRGISSQRIGIDGCGASTTASSPSGEASLDPLTAGSALISAPRSGFAFVWASVSGHAIGRRLPASGLHHCRGANVRINWRRLLPRSRLARVNRTTFGNFTGLCELEDRIGDIGNGQQRRLKPRTYSDDVSVTSSSFLKRTLRTNWCESHLIPSGHGPAKSWSVAIK